jgi:hypothetical protein
MAAGTPVRWQSPIVPAGSAVLVYRSDGVGSKAAAKRRGLNEEEMLELTPALDTRALFSRTLSRRWPNITEMSVRQTYQVRCGTLGGLHHVRQHGVYRQQMEENADGHLVKAHV